MAAVVVDGLLVAVADVVCVEAVVSIMLTVAVVLVAVLVVVLVSRTRAMSASEERDIAVAAPVLLLSALGGSARNDSLVASMEPKPCRTLEPKNS